MRKVLLRVVFDQFWKFESLGNELLVGYGIAICIWLVIALVSLGVLWRATKDSSQVLSSLVFWGVVPFGLVAVPFLNLSIAGSGVPLGGWRTW